ncbi:MAG: response regulator [Lentimicrobiaceae bacterium]|nr:response regulator [Lentimicrobiaceae bacterium]MCO5264667.1 ATP-binding protein [Lentimicrobium sp.]
MDEVNALKKILERERKARKAAEQVIEQKSLEIYQMNQHLLTLNEELEIRIKKRTSDIEASRQELLLAKELAEKATNAKSLFLSSMSHEIRTPLNGIVGITNLMLESCTDEKMLGMLQKVKASADNLMGIINDILDFSKIEAGKISFESIPFSARELLDMVEATFEQRFKAKSLSYQFLSDAGISYYIKGDRLRLLQVLNNLIGNAIKFTESGSVEVSLRILRETESQVWLRGEVRDTGIGIPEDKLDKVFEQFAQSEAETTRKYGGTGLGLTISKQLIELQGGVVGLQSREGEGSVFWFEVPYEKGEPFRPVLLKENEVLNCDFGGKKVLLVEDNKINQYVALHFLIKYNLKVDVANHGLEALDYLANGLYDIVLMDLHMPEMDGYTTTINIRNGSFGVKQPGIPVIALSADAFTEARDKVFMAGMNDYATKPFHPEQFLLILQKWLHHDK